MKGKLIATLLIVWVRCGIILVYFDYSSIKFVNSYFELVDFELINYCNIVVDH